MKKEFLLAALVCVPVGLYADAEVVHVSITLCRDKEKCSDKRWAEIVAPVQALRKQADATAEDALEMVDAVTHAMRSVMRNGESGIHGEIAGVVSDGECASSCSDECPCKESGACLCAVKGTACVEECGCPGGDPMDKEAVRGCEDGSCTRDDK